MYVYNVFRQDKKSSSYYKVQKLLIEKVNFNREKLYWLKAFFDLKDLEWLTGTYISGVP